MIDVDALIGGDRPHPHRRASVGHIARQILQLHPHGHLATVEEAQELVDALAITSPDVREYRIGGELGGQIGGPGTWIGIVQDRRAGGRQTIYHVSPFIDEIFTNLDRPADPTLIDRLQAEIGRRLKEIGDEIGETIAVPTLRIEEDTTNAAFANDDVIHYAGAGGEDRFTGWFSHIDFANARRTTLESLDKAVKAIMLHHRHGAKIREAVTATHMQVVKRFAAMDAAVGEPTLLSLEEMGDGSLGPVATVTPLEILGDALLPTTVLLTRRWPVRIDKGEMDGWRIHARDHRRRQKILAGRQQRDAITVCKVVADTIETMSDLERVLMMDALETVANGTQGAEDPSVGDIVRGIAIKDGHIFGTVAMAAGTWRSRTVQIPQTQLPETILAALVAKPMTAVLDEPRLADKTITRASVDSKGRLNIVTEGNAAISLKEALKRCQNERK